MSLFQRQEPKDKRSLISMADSISSTSSQKRIAVVTGGNKGIGLEICRQLACKGGIEVVLTARDEKRGVEALEKLKTDGLSDVVFHQLDVTDLTSIASLVDFLSTQFGKVDILVNNAAVGGLALDYQVLGIPEGSPPQDISSIRKAMRESYEDAGECVETNYYGVKRVTEALIPLLKLSTSPRIVILSSLYGRLRNIPNERLREELKEVISLSEERMDKILQKFLQDFKVHELEKNGWPTNVSAYKVSKVLVSSYTRILARRYPDFIINCVDPGIVKTDMNWNTGPLTVEQGASGPVMLALLPHGSPSGLFYELTQVSSYE